MKINIKLIFLFTFFYYLLVAYFKGGLWEDELAIMADVLLSPTILDLIKEFKYEVHAPGVWLVAYLFSKANLTDEFVLRIPSTLMAAIGVASFVRIAKRYLTSEYVLLFWGLILSLPALSWHASEMRPHVYLFGFGSLIVCFLHSASYRSDSRLFWKDINKAAIVFLISLFFHFATFFILVGILPFIIKFKSRIKNEWREFLGKYRNLYIFAVCSVAVFAAILIYLNLESVLWGQYSTLERLFKYTMFSFLGFKNTAAKLFTFCVLSFIGFSFYYKKKESEMRYFVVIYLWCLSVLLTIELLGYPLSRTKYSLYILPILTLVLVRYISDLKNRAFRITMLIALLTVIPVNLFFGGYIRPPKAKEMLNLASNALKNDREATLVIFGASRGLEYYLQSIELPKERVFFCQYQPKCLTDLFKDGHVDKIYLLFYKTTIGQYVFPLIYNKLLLNDDFGYLLQVTSLKNNQKNGI